MPDRTAYFTNWQVRAALEGRLSVLFVPMNPQPPEGVTYRGYYADEDMHLWTASYSLDDCPIAKSPFAPGDTLLCKEALYRGEWGDANDAVYYRADDEPAWDMTRPCVWVWKRDAISAAQMPAGLVRIKFTVKAVSAVQVCEVSEEDARLSGTLPDCLHSKLCSYSIYTSAFRDKWENRYGKRYPWDTAWAWRLDVETCSGE